MGACLATLQSVSELSSLQFENHTPHGALIGLTQNHFCSFFFNPSSLLHTYIVHIPIQWTVGKGESERNYCVVCVQRPNFAG